MLNLLKIKNIALIDSLELEFGPGLNLLTGETGSGKSIIVDSLGALAGERVTNDLIKDGSESAQIEGLFTIERTEPLAELLDETGIEAESELIVRREISLAGKNRIFVNNQLVTAAFLKRLGEHLVDIHGQGEQTSLFDSDTHLELLDEYAKNGKLRDRVAAAYEDWSQARRELNQLQRGESEKLQLLDILKFQVDEIRKADLKPEEEAGLDEEKRRLNNVEKLNSLSGDALDLLYDADDATVTTLERAIRKIDELAEYDSRFADYKEGLNAAQAVLNDLSFAVRAFSTHLEFSHERLAEIEDRLAEITRVARKYGGSVGSALVHLAESEAKLYAIENAEIHQEEAKKRVRETRNAYISAAAELSAARSKAAGKFSKEVENALSAVALNRAKFEVRVESAGGNASLNGQGDPLDAPDSGFTRKGFDAVEFLFSANSGESVKQLARVASGGEASRLMLILKTAAKEKQAGKAVVFDEIDAGIGGRVAEAVGTKLKELATGQQVLCVTHQAQVASKADVHFVVEKTMTKSRTAITVRPLDDAERIEEIARMLAGEKITDAARENAREMIAAAG
ncbi:MAG: DNA repair protein RecN [bacterium]|nr:DNA repair protein RecN [bacterium]